MSTDKPSIPPWVTDDLLVEATTKAVTQVLDDHQDKVAKAQAAKDRRTAVGFPVSQRSVMVPIGYVTPEKIASTLADLRPALAEALKDEWEWRQGYSWNYHVGRALKPRLERLVKSGKLTAVGGRSRRSAPGYNGTMVSSTYNAQVLYAPTEFVATTYQRAYEDAQARYDSKVSRRDTAKRRATEHGLLIESASTTSVTVSLEQFESILDHLDKAVAQGRL